MNKRDISLNLSSDTWF